jgi:hypothetical protein
MQLTLTKNLLITASKSAERIRVSATAETSISSGAYLKSINNKATLYFKKFKQMFYFDVCY